ncbi:Transcription factor iws1 [Coemansia sp. Benny D115]|nr:Transcription factor iws1 [Coemansia sp. Benny D115]
MSSDERDMPSESYDNEYGASRASGLFGDDPVSDDDPQPADDAEEAGEVEDGQNNESAEPMNAFSMPKIPKRARPTTNGDNATTAKSSQNNAAIDELDTEDGAASGAEEQKPVDPKQAELDEMNQKIDAILKSGRTRRRKRTDDDDAAVDEMIVELRKRMRDAAYRDIDDNKDRLPATHKLSMLPDVLQELEKTQLYEAFLDNNIVESIRLWLEPLDDGSLPNLDIQNAMLNILGKLPIRRDHLRESGIGKIILFMSKCPRISERNRRTCEQFVQQWSRMVLRLSSDYRDKKVKETTVDLRRKQFSRSQQQAAVARAAASSAVPGALRVESSSGKNGERVTARIPQRVAAGYTVMPVSSLSLTGNQPASSRNTSDKYKRIKQAMGRGGR